MSSQRSWCSALRSTGVVRLRHATAPAKHSGQGCPNQINVHQTLLKGKDAKHDVRAKQFAWHALPVCAICSIAMLTAVLSPCPGVRAVQPPHWLDCDRVPPPRAAPLRRPVRPGKTGMVIALASTGQVVKPKYM